MTRRAIHSSEPILATPAEELATTKLLPAPIDSASSPDLAPPEVAASPIQRTAVPSLDPTVGSATPETDPSGQPVAPTIEVTSPTESPSALLLEQIRTLGGVLDDLERVRIMNGNRVGAFERDYGESLPYHDVIQKQLRVAEHVAELELKRAWRKHPLAPWAKTYRGAGEKSVARLVAVIGDPGERPNVAKLWAYCGVGDPKRRRVRGMTQEEAFKLGSPAAKKQVWLIATSMLKSGNRDYYDQARAKYEERDWTDGHRHAAALRYAGKMFLRDLWVAARQHYADTQSVIAGGTTTRASSPVCGEAR